MNLSLKKIVTVFLVLFLLSRTRVILQWFSGLDTDGVFTLQPLADQPAEARYVVTLLFIALIIVAIWKFIIIHDRRSRNHDSKSTKSN